METNTHTQADPRPLFADVTAVTTSVISSVGDHQLDRPTPCAAFDVAALLDHLALVAPRIASLGRGEPDFSRKDGGTQGWPVESITAIWSTEIGAATVAWSDPESLTRQIELPWATMAGAEVLTMYLSELVVHTWDLARATGQTVAFDPAAVETSLVFMRQALPAEIRSTDGADEVPFAPVVDIAADAPLLDQLVAWTGRHPDWA